MKRIFMILFVCIGLFAIPQANAQKIVMDGFIKAFKGATFKEAKFDPTGKIM